MNFELEAENCKRCGEIFKGNANVAVPKVYSDFTSERVLTMSFEAGTSVTQVQDLHKQGIDLRRCAKLISEAFIHMIFIEGFVHSDPHPGNIHVRPTVLPNGKKDVQVVILDHGIYTDLTEETRLSYNKLWRGILT